MSGLRVRLQQSGPIPLDAAFDCAPGEMLALFGPSGAGKSTILRAIAGLARVAAGRIAVDGAVWFDAGAGRYLPAHARRVGFVFQSYALFPHMTAEANIAAALGHLPKTARGVRARELLEQVHLHGLADRRPHALSGGQQQRVALARALAREPQLLLLDEPFAAVDRVTRDSLYRELALLRRRLSVPTLLVTHDLGEARLLVDRLCLIDGGRILQADAPERVIAAPASAAAARLLGHRNIFPATVRAVSAEGVRLDWAAGSLRAANAPQGLSAGEAVDWLAAPDALSIDDSAGDAGDNTVTGRIAECIRLGETSFLGLDPGSGAAGQLALQLPAAEANRRALAPGMSLTCRIPPDRIHLMQRA